MVYGHLVHVLLLTPNRRVDSRGGKVFMDVCLFVCLSAIWQPLSFYRAPSGGVTKYQGEGTISGVSSRATVQCMGRPDYATNDRFGLNLFTIKSDRIQFPIIKRHNCDQLFRSYSHTKLLKRKGEISRLMGRIAETHYAVVIVTMETVYVAEQRNMYW